MPPPVDQQVNGVTVPALIWRYWQSHGGEAIFGLPLEPARITADGVTQTFTNARLELRPTLADTAFLVQPTPLRIEQAALPGARPGGAMFAVAPQLATQNNPPGYLPPPPSLAAPVLTFEQTGHSLSGAFLTYWRRNGGAAVFGLPTSTEVEQYTADGQRRTVQYFERAIFAYYPEDGSVRLEPLGWQELIREQVRAPWHAAQVR
ncbi:MAG: hypothetical protein HC893_01725 [Chloroflexaceae bacterium]|nr:hypothetical protein [Chloroflexaceae bacterium]